MVCMARDPAGSFSRYGIVAWQNAITTKCLASTGRGRRRDQEGLSQARDEAPSGPQSGRRAKESEEKFKEAKEAYEILSDANKRARLRPLRPCRRRSFGRRGAGGGRHGRFRRCVWRHLSRTSSAAAVAGSAAAPTCIAAPTCATTWKSRWSRRRAATRRKIRIPAVEACEVCHGSGAKPGTQPKTCPTCNGAGQVRMQQGFFSIQQTCPTCHGTGKVIPDPCSPCGGSGRVKKHKTLSVKIPAGVDEGDRIRLSGEWRAGHERRAAWRSLRADDTQAARGVPARRR